MNTTIKPFVSITGAGPGDPELISVKALKSIQNADVILYDALVNKVLLKEAKKEAIIIYVGKRANQHTYSQDQINQLIVENALNYGHVVRLKGGDPFVFGRGQEEIEYLSTFGIDYEYIPGISSFIAAPGLQGIPLTKRGLNESFWVITATTKNNELSHDLKLAAQSTATVGILMGTKKLAEIQDLFLQNNHHDTPFAIIQNSSMPNEKVVTGIVSELKVTAESQGIGSPAVIIIGKVAGLHSQFIEQFENYELLNR